MILLSFASLIAFHVLVGFVPVDLALAIAAGIALIVLAADHALSSGGIKVLNLGTFALFVALSVVGAIAHPAWNPLWVRLIVNAGLLAIVLFTFAIHRPFTLQYAREATPAPVSTSPTFLRTNYLISTVWAAVFVVLVLADLARLFILAVPHWLDTAVGISGMVIATKFTKWYPGRVSVEALPRRRPLETSTST
jgi:hypothetical protein